MKQGAWFTLAFGAAFIGVLSAVCYAFAPQVISLFRKDPEVIRIGSEALRIMCIFLVCLPASVVGNMLFQSIGKSGMALILACLQSGLLFIPLCLLLSRFLGIRGIEMAQPLAYCLSAVISLPITIRFLGHMPQDG